MVRVVIIHLLSPMLGAKDTKGGFRDIKSIVKGKYVYSAFIIFNVPYNSALAFGVNNRATIAFASKGNGLNQTNKVRFIIGN